MFGNYRDCQAWKDVGMQLNTTSNEACEMYDATLRQICLRRDDSCIGGVKASIDKMIEADPSFVMGSVCDAYMITGDKPWTDQDVRNSVEKVNNLAKSQWKNLTDMERGHCKAVQSLGKGQWKSASFEWENILADYPKDFLALKKFYEMQIVRAEFEQQRNVVARVLPYYSKKTDIEYCKVAGMYAFSLQETNFFDAGEQRAKEALEHDCHDAWATHALAHVYEMTGRYNEGLEFMKSTENDWKIIKGLACHNNWHRTLYHIEKGDNEGALNIYDEHIEPQVLSGMFQASDAITMLYRLRMQGVDVGKSRWQNILTQIDKTPLRHWFAYYDASIMMGLAAADTAEKSESFLESIHELAAKDDGSDLHQVSKSVNQYICEAVHFYETEEYDKAVEVLHPLRYNIQEIGASFAQREIFHLLILHAAMKSEHHQNLARQLILERKSLKDTPLSDILMSKIQK